MERETATNQASDDTLAVATTKALVLVLVLGLGRQQRDVGRRPPGNT
jgi:hypothetical protein